MDVVSLIGFVQAIFLSNLIFFKKKKNIKDYILLIFILLIGLKLLTIYGEYRGWNETFPYLIIADLFYWNLLGPLLYLYVKITISGESRFQIKYLLHLLPLFFVFIAFSDYLNNFIHNTNFGTYMSEPGRIIPKTGLYVFQLVSPFYYVWAIIILSKYRKSILDFFSTKKDVDKKWLFYLTNGFAAYLIVGVIGLFMMQIFNFSLPFNIYSYSSLILVIYIFGLGYIGLTRNIVLHGYKDFVVHKGISIPHKDYISNRTRYEKSTMTNSEASVLISELNELMNNKKLYLDCQLNLKTLAEALNTNTHRLSQSLNEYQGENFFDFVNRYRIEEVKKRMADPESEKFKIIAIAYDCGFNSRSGFYNSFRKFTGQTPTDYMSSVSQA